LAKNGFMPLVHRKNSDFAAFIGAQSLHKPAEYDDPDATANANLAARLPYLFATCRFAHYLKCIVRDKIGSFKEREDVQRGCRTGSPSTWTATRYVFREPPRPASRCRRPRSSSKRTPQPGLLQLQVLPAPALPARRADGLAAAGFQTAIGKGRLIPLG
jgi:type VI secretion system ImpC/EvpB family protein